MDWFRDYVIPAILILCAVYLAFEVRRHRRAAPNAETDFIATVRFIRQADLSFEYDEQRRSLIVETSDAAIVFVFDGGKLVDMETDPR